MVKKKSRKIKIQKLVALSVLCTTNNTIIHANCGDGSSFVTSAGTAGLTGARRSTVHAANETASLVGSKLRAKKIDGAIIFFKGFGWGRKSVLRALKKK